MKKKSSLLDFAYPGLCSNIYMQDGTLNPVVKDFIFKLINSFYNSYGFKNPEAWVLDVTNIGSLTTNKYIRQSDFDCHISVNINKFIETNMPKASKEEAFDALDEARKEWDRAKILLPFGEHALELFFESSEMNPSNTDNCGRYSLLQDKWLKDPIFFAQDDDFSEMHKKVIEEAKELAGELDTSFAEIGRQIQRIDELNDVLKAWPEDKRQLYYKKIQDKLDIIEEEIENDIKIKEDLVNARHSQHDLMSDIEVKFKYLGRFFYFSIINDLKAIVNDGITIQELPLIEKVISEASLNKKSLVYGYWIAPDGKEFVVSNTHDQWVRNEADFLKNTYNIDITKDKPAVPTLIDNGWTRVTAISDGQFTLLVKDISNLSSYLDNFISQHFIPNKNEGIIVEQMNDKWLEITDPFPSIQQAVNKALQRKRMGALKEAFLKQAFEKQNLAIDFDGTIAKELPNLVIGEPEPGVKEALTKLQEDGYTIEIYSHRANTEDGADEIKNYLDKHEIPYDTILHVEKPLAIYYIDNRGIHFTNWDEVLKQIEKSDKTASLHISASSINLPVIDPKTFKRKEPYALFIGTQMFSKTEGIDLFDVFGEHPMINEHNQMPTVNMDVLIQNNIPVIGKEPRAGNKQPFQDISKIVKQAQIGSAYDFSSTQFNLPKELSEKIIRWAIEEIPENEIVYDEKDPSTKGIQLESHITLKYGLLTDDFKEIEKALKGEKAPKIKFGKTSFFEPEGKDYDVVIIEVESDDLNKLNKKICDNVKHENPQGDEYHPHATIAYVKRGLGKKYAGKDILDGEEITLNELIFSPKIGEKSTLELGKNKKEASGDNFLPSLFNAPNNDWQFQEEGSDQEIALNPDSVSDDITEYEPCTTGKPRNKDTWRQFMSIFKQPISKKEEMTIDSAYDKELEEAEAKAMGEETLLEYSKGFYDPKKHDFPHNTTWDSLTQDGEPSKPTSVTYSPQISNEDNLDQNSPGGYPRRFMGKPKGEWFSNEGEVNNALIDMLKNREAALDSMTKIAGNADGGWISPTGQYIPTSDHFGYVATHLADFGLSQLEESTQTKFELDSAVVRAMQYIFDQGWLRVRVWGDAILIQGNNINNVKSHAEDFIYDNLESAKRIRIETDNEQAYTCTTDEFKAEGWDAFLKQPIMAKQAVLDFDNQYPLASGSVDGRTVIDGVPNQSSIGASLTDYDILPGIREVSFSSFTQMPNLSYYSVDEEKRTKQLAEQIQQSNEITPLIVAVDNQGPYILEGGHRFDALRELGANSFPAMVVLDNESLNRMAKQASSNSYWIDPKGEVYIVPGTTHDIWMINESQLLKNKYNIDTEKEDWRNLIERGWTRVNATDDSVSMEVADLNNIPPFLTKFIREYMGETPKVFIEDRLNNSRTIPFFRGNFLKTAGDQSASVPDYLIDEWKTDQLHDDISEEPYVNHDQRDYPYGMHDSPENTAFNIGWAKDNQPYVVRLDILEDPAYRLDPFGIGEYNVTWYTSLPASDGIEATNPD